MAARSVESVARAELPEGFALEVSYRLEAGGRVGRTEWRLRREREQGSELETRLDEPLFLNSADRMGLIALSVLRHYVPGTNATAEELGQIHARAMRDLYAAVVPQLYAAGVAPTAAQHAVLAREPQRE